MDTAFIKVLNMSISASWLVLAVLILRLLLKRSPRWILVALWALVAVRLIFPVSIESPASLIPSRETIPETIMYARNPAIDSGVEVLDQVVNDTVMDSLTPQMGNSINPVQAHLFVQENIWCLGMGVMLLWALISYLRLKRKVAASIDVGNGVYICDYIATPFILGILKPRIYLPSAMAPDSAPHVLAHERSHIARKDHWWKPLGYLLLTVHWFNPVLWLAYILLCRDIELACDEKVIRDMEPPQKKAYSEALLNCSVNRRYVAACPLAFGEVGVKERVKTVLNYRKPAFWIVLIAIVALMITAVCFLTDPVKEETTTYRVEKVVYQNPLLSVYMTEADAPLFEIGKDHSLRRKENGKEWEELGKLTEIKLSDINLDNLFFAAGVGLEDDLALSQLRAENQESWVLSVPPGEDASSFEFYLLFRQQDGTMYLGQGIGLSRVYPLHEHILDSSLAVNWLYRLCEDSQENKPVSPYALNEIYWAKYLKSTCVVTIPRQNGSAQVVFDGEKYTISDDAGSRSYQYCVKSQAESPKDSCTEYFFLTDDPEMTVQKYLERTDILPTEVLYIDSRTFAAVEEYGDVPASMNKLWEAGVGGTFCQKSMFQTRNPAALSSSKVGYQVARVDYNGNLLCEAIVKGVPNEFLELEDGGFAVYSWSVPDEKDRVSCYDEAGNLRWFYTLEDGVGGYVDTMYQHNGDIYCFGVAKLEDKLDDIFIWRISPDGEVKQKVNFGGSDFESVLRVLETETGFTIYGRTQSKDGDMAFSKDGYGVGFRAEVGNDLELVQVEEFEDWNFTVVGYHEGKPVFIDDPILKISRKDNFPEDTPIGAAGFFDWNDGYVIVRYICYEKYPYQNPLVSMSQKYGRTVMTGYDSEGNPLWQIAGPVFGG